MAGAVTDRAFRATTPERIEADLAALWREIGAADIPVARAVMSNLVVFRDRTLPAEASAAAIVEGLPLDEVAARHPSRTIVLEHCYDAAAAGPLSAAVGVTIFGPPHARYGVEQIVVRSGCPDEALLSILRRFVRGDLPTTVWWTEDLSAAPALEPFIEVGRQLLYDSRQWRDVPRGMAAVRAACSDDRIDPADLNWRRLAPMRRALEHARGPLQSMAWRSVPVRIVAPAGEEALAWLCAGWLRAARGERDRAAVTVEQAVGQRGGEGRDGSAAAPALTVIVDGFTATLTDRGAVVDGATPPLVVSAAVESEADAIAAELRTLGRDTTFVSAVRALAGMER
jgi:glucose-6-phosphate dehydrogenase assembly protein OpcA